MVTENQNKIMTHGAFRPFVENSVMLPDGQKSIPNLNPLRAWPITDMVLSEDFMLSIQMQNESIKNAE